MQILSSQLQNKNKERKQFLIEDRRRRVTSLLAQSRTETEIATELQVHVSTISRDVTYLKKKVNNLYMIWQNLILLSTISNVLMVLKRLEEKVGRYIITIEAATVTIS